MMRLPATRRGRIQPGSRHRHGNSSASDRRARQYVVETITRQLDPATERFLIIENDVSFAKILLGMARGKTSRGLSHSMVTAVWRLHRMFRPGRDHPRHRHAGNGSGLKVFRV